MAAEDEPEDEIPEGAEGNGTQNEGNGEHGQMRSRRIRTMLKLMLVSAEERQLRQKIVEEKRQWRLEAELDELRAEERRLRQKIMEDEGNKGNVTQNEGSEATPPLAKKARLLED